MNTELHERFEKQLVGLNIHMEFYISGIKLTCFTHNFFISNPSRVTSIKCKRTSGQWRSRSKKYQVAVKKSTWRI